MKAAHDGVHLVDARGLLRSKNRVNDAAMATGADHDESFASQVEGCAELMDGVIDKDVRTAPIRVKLRPLATLPWQH